MTLQLYHTLSVRLAATALSVVALTTIASAQTIVGLPSEPTSNWPHPVSPDGNPFPRNSTGTPAEIKQRDSVIRLGKMLFWDEQVSVDNTVACGTCHSVEAGGTDDRLGAIFTDPLSNDDGNFGAFGVIPQALDTNGRIAYGFTSPPSSEIARSVTPVHTPTMIGAYLFSHLFWDGRAGPTFLDESGMPFPPIPPSTTPSFSVDASLESLSVGPPLNQTEMGHQNMTWGAGLLESKISSSHPLALVDPATIPPELLLEVTSGVTYRRLFDRAFFGHPIFGGSLGATRERFAMAVAHYQRTLIPDGAPIDRGAMTQDQIDGFNLLKPPTANCFVCHSFTGNPTLGPTGRLINEFDNLFSDGALFHQISVTPSSPARKTPTLRNLGLRKKFFSTGHGGDGVGKIMVTNLDELITFYDDQPGFTGFNGSGPGGTLTSAERGKIRDFLENALTDRRVIVGRAPFDHPILASQRPEFDPFEGNEFGVGTSGPSGLVPEIIANSPPLVIKPALVTSATPRNWFKVGVGNAPSNAPAALLFSTTIGTGPLFVGFPISSSTPVSTNSQGIATVFKSFPLTTAALGIPVFTQWVIADTNVRILSDAAQFTPFQF